MQEKNPLGGAVGGKTANSREPFGGRNYDSLKVAKCLVI